MILFNTVMQNEKIAVIALVVIIVGALSVFLAATYGEDILNNLFQEEKTIELGDCADVNYIGTLVNGTVFESSYTYPDNKTGGTPLKIFVTMNKSETPPTEYPQYLSDRIEGFMEGLVGLKEGETATIGPIPPEKAYGVTPKVGDIIDLSALGGGEASLKVLEVNENAPMPSEMEEWFPGVTQTTVYVVRDESHYIGEIIDTYVDDESIPHWENATVVTKINETLLWKYTTPLEDKYENLTWVDTNLIEQYQITYPADASKITSINETIFIVTITPAINETIQVYDDENPYGLYYIVENVTDDKIITYLDDDSSVENRTIREFDRNLTVQRNETVNITYLFPSEYLEMLFEYLRSADSSTIYSTGELADKTLYFEVEIVEVYKTS
jgi:FKBP-type peptidyl-prolyl cis-trans isomerase 2